MTLIRPGTLRYFTDMSQWPKIEYGHIFAHFISRPGTYIQEQPLSWKQLEAYNYFENGHLRTVLSIMFGPNHAHEEWMIARKDGQKVCAHCTCMAG